MTTRTIDLGQFERAEQADTAELVRYLEQASTVPGVQRCKQIALAELALQPGQTVLDVGCGYGGDVAELAGRVSPDGRAVGVDLSDTMVTEARQRYEITGLPVSFHTADARRLGFPGETIDACRCERLLQHVQDPGRVAAEMARVTRPAGRVAAIEFDLGGLMIDHPDQALTSQVVAAIAGSTVNGWIGRELGRLLSDAGLNDLVVHGELIAVSQAFLMQIYKPALRRAPQPGSARRAAGCLGGEA
jgi:ubiquinone/menaquinone biosynthesis C-methylase UbiE